MELKLSFKYNQLDVPNDVDPKIMEVLGFIFGDSSKLSEDEREKKEKIYFEALQKLIKSDLKDSFLSTVYSIACFYRQKFETALFFIVRAIILNPHNTFASRVLIQYMIVFRYQDLEPRYFNFADRGSTALCNYLLEAADCFFEQDKFEMVDFYVQRRNDLQDPIGSQQISLDEAIYNTERHIKDGNYDKQADLMVVQQQEKIKFEDKKNVAFCTDKWQDDLNKKLLAKHTAKLLGNGTCVELGSHSGALLHMIQGERVVNSKLVGIDPDREAIKLGKKEFKDIDLIVGNDSSMVDGTICLPEKFDVLLLSDICLLLKQEALNKIFAFVKDRCKYIVIMDDIVNIFGDFSVMRRIYFLHPYKKLLEQNGFKIIDKTFVPNPNEANTGILTAKREGK